MKKIASLHGLKTETGANENVWLLLYKKGSEQSDCALENFQRAGEAAAEMKKNNVLCSADVNEVKDIHPEFGVTTVPALLYFEKGQLRNLVKGCHRPEQFNAIFDKSAATVVANGEKKPQKSVTVYTTPTCTWCNTIKRYDKGTSVTKLKGHSLHFSKFVI